ncbi:pimeloyl-ACP methyl ester carboxylesterase [Rhizobium sp. BK313]|uniref:alpha/beta fold hydrolase n=1 Tax=Rhizobium sp. BK313 TaxID=2587081 RepID=UPI00105D73FF|nr:alpha/beta hydrolase [Rhizobium sp. BK313]MBB3457192.1 pimeloyl-ACP methyl ester carboxylesterase [Rhizobium sp. BK313]
MIKHILFRAAVALAVTTAGPLSIASAAEVKNIVIVHGAFADGSGWRTVSDILTKDGYKVAIVQEPLISLADDVAATKRVLDLQNGPSVLVGHSYGGMVISDAGNADNVAALVYVAAFQPDKGESLAKLVESKPVEHMRKNGVKATPDGFLYMDPEAVHEMFAADLPQAEADFIGRSQVFASQKAFGTEAGEPAWKKKPSFALVATEDRSINPDLERSMAKRAGSKIYEAKASHAVFLSKPNDVAKLIEEAAKAVSN